TAAGCLGGALCRCFRGPGAGRGHVAPRPSRALNQLGVEAEMHDVAVLHYVPASFDARLARFTALRLAAVMQKVLPANDLGFDEAAFKVGVDDAGCPRRGPTIGNRPCAALFLTRGEISDEPEQLVAGADHLVQAGLAQPCASQEVRAIGGVEL